MQPGAVYCSANTDNTRVLTPTNGYFDAYIVVPLRASEIERHAAEELRKYFGKITGGEIAVIRERDNLEHFGFYVGLTQKGSIYAPARNLPYEGSNGFRIKSIPNGLVIIGGDDLSTLFGVYAFLEEYQGCGWFMPYEPGEVVPQRDGIVVPSIINITQIPDFPIRWVGMEDWALKNRMNCNGIINGHETGVRKKWGYHTFQYLLPPEGYFSDHPEYYSLPEEHRAGTERWQVCTSNPEAVKLIAQHLIDNFTRDPDIDFISLAANDWRNWCRCSRCREQIEPERTGDPYGEQSGPIFIFSNEVARRVKKSCPDKIVKGGAYFHHYQRYPLDPGYVPEDNLAIQVCHLGYCHNHPINDPDCPYNVDYMRDLRKWAENARHLFIYEYSALHGWAQMPWPLVHCLREDVPEYHRLGAEMFFTQYWYLSASYALNYHVAAKLAWNASYDVDVLISDFCSKMYGAAGPAMERYHRFLEDNWAHNGLHYSYVIETASLAFPKFFNQGMMAYAEELLRAAESIDADSLSRARVHQIRTDFEYVRLVLNYLEAISVPFEGLHPQRNPVAWENAAKCAASTGEILSAHIREYLKGQYPESIKLFWGTAVDRMLEAHRSPSRIPGAQRAY